MPPELAEQASARCRRAADDRAALEAAADAVAQWGEQLVEACAPYAAGVKLQLACFEQLRGPGWEAACRVAKRARELGLLVIADGKRGDIPTTMQAYGSALFGPLRLPGGREVPGLDADAATLDPYTGDDAVEALGRWLGAGRGAFVLVHTSNPSAGRFQDLELRDGGTLAEAVAQTVASWAARWPGARGYGAVGAVIGATYPQVLAALREVLRGVWVLLAGVGPQGGKVEWLQAAFNRDGLGAVVAASRQVMAAWQQAPEEDWRTACARAASSLREAIEQVRLGRGG